MTGTSTGRDAPSRLKQAGVGLLVVLMAVGMVAAFAAPAAAQDVSSGSNGTPGTPADIAAQNADVTQDVAEEDIVIDGISGQTHAVKIDISSLTQAGVDISGASVSTANIELDDGSDSVDFARVNQDNEEIRLVISESGNSDVTITSLPLEGLDTSGVESQTGLDYVVEVSNSGNNGDFGSGFTTADIATTGQFNVAFIENVDQGETYSSISAALTADELSAGDTIEVGPGQYDEQVFVAVPDVTLTSTAGAEDTTITFDGTAQGANPKNEETVSIHAGGVTVEGFTIERADGGNDDAATQAVAVRQTAGSSNPVEVTNNIVEFPAQTPGNADDSVGIHVRGGSSGSFADFTNSDFGSSDSIDISNAENSDLSLSNVVIDNNEVDIAPGAGSNSATAVNIYAVASSQDYSDITVSNNDLLGEDAGAGSVGVAVEDTSTSATASNIVVENNNIEEQQYGLFVGAFENEVSATNNEFVANDLHVSDDTSNFDLDATFDNNNFVNANGDAQYVIAENVDGEIQQAIFGELDDLIDGTGTSDVHTIATDQTTTIAGNHTVDSTIDVDSHDGIGSGADGAVVTSPDTADGKIIQGSTPNPIFNLDDAELDGLEISGLTIETSDAAIDTGASIDDITVTDNEFVGIDSSTAVSITNSISSGLTVTNNDFNSESTYTAIDLGDGNIGTTAGELDADISGNTIDSTAGVTDGILLGTTSDADLEVAIESNTLTNVTNLGIQVGSGDGNDYQNSDAEVTISDNEIAGTGEDAATGIDILVDANSGSGTLDNILVEANTVASVDNGAGSGTALLIDQGTNNSPEPINTDNILDNEFNGNAAHFDLTDAGYDDSDVEAVVSQNNFDPVVAASSTEQSQAVEDLSSYVLHGTVEAAVDADPAYVNVGAGTYEESQIAVDSSQELISMAGADQTVISTTEEQNIIDVSAANVVIDGFTFSSDTDDASADVKTTGGDGFELLNSTFSGPSSDAETRTAVSIESISSTPTVENVSIDGYGTGIDVTTGGGVTVSSSEVSNAGVGIATGGSGDRVEDSTITNSDVGVALDHDAAIVRNTISGNTVGIESAAGGATIHFNDIVNNEDAGVDYATDSQGTVDSLRANWWGDADGPDVSTDTGADIVENSENDVANSGNGDRATPWLTSSYTELPQDRMVVIPDPSAPPADATAGNSEGARLLVAVLDDDLATGTDVTSGNTAFIVEGPDDDLEDGQGTPASIGGDLAGSLTVSDPLQVPDYSNGDSLVPADDTPGDYTVTAVNTEDAVNSGSATQTFSGAVADVDVTTDTTDLTADGETTANVTLQLVDSEGNAVPRSGIGTSWSIDNNQDAGVERVSADTTTDADGQATLTVTADTAGETFTVTGIDNSNNNADNVDINAVAPTSANFTVDLVSGPEEIVQNESYTADVSVTNTGDGAGTQTIEYVLEDSAGLSSGIEASQEVTLEPGASQTVTFEVAASDTDALSTGDYTHVVASDDDEATLAATVVEPQQQPDAPDVNGNGNAATDTDGDGQFEDINGDGTSDILDVQVLFSNLNSDAVQNNTELFDFNGDGEVSILDVQALFSQQSDSGSGDR